MSLQIDTNPTGTELDDGLERNLNVCMDVMLAPYQELKNSNYEYDKSKKVSELIPKLQKIFKLHLKTYWKYYLPLEADRKNLQNMLWKFAFAGDKVMVKFMLDIGLKPNWEYLNKPNQKIAKDIEHLLNGADKKIEQIDKISKIVDSNKDEGEKVVINKIDKHLKAWFNGAKKYFSPEDIGALKAAVKEVLKYGSAKTSLSEEFMKSKASRSPELFFAKKIIEVISKFPKDDIKPGTVNPRNVVKNVMVRELLKLIPKTYAMDDMFSNSQYDALIKHYGSKNHLLEDKKTMKTEGKSRDDILLDVLNEAKTKPNDKVNSPRLDTLGVDAAIKK